MIRPMTRTALIAIALAACDAVPGNPRAPRPAHLDDAAEVARDLWSDEFGVDLPAPPPPIEWLAGDCLDVDAPGYACVRGWYAGGAIYLAARPAIADTLLAHEMLHWVLDQYGDSDGTHEAPAWRTALPDVEAAILAWELLQSETPR